VEQGKNTKCTHTHSCIEEEIRENVYFEKELAVSRKAVKAAEAASPNAVAASVAPEESEEAESESEYLPTRETVFGSSIIGCLRIEHFRKHVKKLFKVMRGEDYTLVEKEEIKRIEVILKERLHKYITLHPRLDGHQRRSYAWDYATHKLSCILAWKAMQGIVALIKHSTRATTCYLSPQDTGGDTPFETCQRSFMHSDTTLFGSYVVWDTEKRVFIRSETAENTGKRMKQHGRDKDKLLHEEGIFYSTLEHKWSRVVWFTSLHFDTDRKATGAAKAMHNSRKVEAGLDRAN
jgi:hypothetical protein